MLPFLKSSVANIIHVASTPKIPKVTQSHLADRATGVSMISPSRFGGHVSRKVAATTKNRISPQIKGFVATAKCRAARYVKQVLSNNPTSVAVAQRWAVEMNR